MRRDRYFDYIIVGAGSAGCVLAARLSEEAGATVCLIEVGPSDRSYWVRNTNPLNMLYLMNSRRYNWRYHTQPAPAAGGRRFFWPRGKGLGGSASINAMIYTRGHRADYDHWAQLGCTGWGYDEVLPWFKKSERQQRGADDYHGVEGAMDVVDSNFHMPVSEAFIEACAQAGIPHNADFNGAEQAGAGFFQLTQTPRGRRVTSSTAFLDGALHRPNLRILTHKRALRLIFEKGDRAAGVVVAPAGGGGPEDRLYAEREVILSAGVIDSPKLLLLSGIGPKEHLEALGIQPRFDLPGVGENLQDHPDILIRCLNRSATSFAVRPGRQSLRFLGRSLRRDPPMIFTPTDCGAFATSRPDLEVPDLQLQFAAVRMRPHGEGLMTPMRSGFVLHVCHMQPKSRGRVRLRSLDERAAPLIEPGYFEEPEDLQTLSRGLRLGREVLSQAAMKPFLKVEESPGPQVESDAQIERFVRENAQTVYHTAGSCKMGVDERAVVDPQLRVHGVRNLRVIDASVMPTIPRANIHAPTVMIAERGAQWIREAAGASSS